MNIEKQLLIARGTLRRLPGLKKSWEPQSTGGTDVSRYCYTVWMRHFRNYYRFAGEIPETVAELGPGDSLGTGFAALLSGSSHLIALDAIKYWDNDRNLRIFEELVELFRNRTPIPDKSEYPRVRPTSDSYDFPADILNEERLRASLSDERLTAIRKEIADIDNPDNTIIKYRIPWDDSSVIRKDSVDFIYSQAALETIDNLENAFIAMRLWLKPGGIMSHTIDLKSHDLTKNWNGHWVFSDFEWKLVRGTRKFLINRQPFSKYMELHKREDFIILLKETVRTENTIDIKALAEPFRNLTEEDLTTSGAYILSKKPGMFD
jgi:SAM-dependent methyltransferase